MKLPKTLFLLILAGLLAGCVGARGIVPAKNTLTDVRASVGSPTDIRFDQNDVVLDKIILIDASDGGGDRGESGGGK